MSTSDTSLTARRVLVTGASGMLGGAVAQLLRDKGHHVRTFQRRASAGAGDEVLGSLTDLQAVAQAVASMDAVIHLAAKVSFTGHWQEFADINVTGTGNLLKAAQDAGIKDFVFVSSPSVAHFGDSLAGAAAGTANPQLAHGHYARSKAAAELDALAADSGAFRVTAIRPHVVWGPGDTQLVERVIERAKAGRLPLLDQGAALIDTTYIDNAAAAIVRGLERMDHAHGRALVVTNGEPRSVGELIAGICQAGGAPVPTLNVPGWLARGAGSVIEKLWLAAGSRGLVQDEPPMTRFLAEQLSTAHWFDQRETHEVLDWKPAVSIDEGLSKLSAHYSAYPA
ncbi:NAD-dependent epimerase/dehydratase family protein [Glutamicibacter sp. JL.03c]|uniref:NAD-dependent epimerase/dehydratase family protein n=1 Tax=Glutamicibacter sp. JL.03c TaxID=2984842 RepID=UPI0021F6F2AA|nr:NAD-dependent epimerase/dehydratase family protein [Glutamicibacter sp. JL.03c]UYQ78499.1 NAD-dependent epimerase/dehydratase family protein [Glutamicibacter sp. JL.03c]